MTVFSVPIPTLMPPFFCITLRLSCFASLFQVEINTQYVQGYTLCYVLLLRGCVTVKPRVKPDRQIWGQELHIFSLFTHVEWYWLVILISEKEHSCFTTNLVFLVPAPISQKIKPLTTRRYELRNLAEQHGSSVRVSCNDWGSTVASINFLNKAFSTHCT